jgi:hypothetical protein
MSKVRVTCHGVSLDGFSAGPNQNLNNPLGECGPAFFSWFFPTETFGNMHGSRGGTTGTDNDIAVAGFHTRYASTSRPSSSTSSTYPTLLGAGKRLFPMGLKIPPTLAESRQFGGGIVLLRYATTISQ